MKYLPDDVPNDVRPICLGVLRFFDGLVFDIRTEWPSYYMPSREPDAAEREYRAQVATALEERIRSDMAYFDRVGRHRSVAKHPLGSLKGEPK